MKWYKRDPSAALAGMIGLTVEERGVYNTVIDLLYARDGDLPNDDRFCAKACECAPQMWRRIRDQLIAKRKLAYDKTGTKLMANRVENELKSARKLIENMTVLGEISAAKRKENKELISAQRLGQPQPHPHPHPEEDKKEKKETGKKILPGSWQPSPNHFELGKERGLSEEEISEAAAEMRDWSEGNGQRRRNWDSVFSNWLRRNSGRKFNGGMGNVETDKQRVKREYREGLAGLRAFGERRENGDFRGTSLRVLPDPRSGGGSESISGCSSGTVLSIPTRGRLQSS